MMSNTSSNQNKSETANAVETAASLVRARLSGRALSAYPGVFPQSRMQAYAVQDSALELWLEAPAGWKVAMVAPAYREAFGEERLSGPVFPTQVLHTGKDGTPRFEVFEHGFAAVEAEFIAVMAVDAPTFGRLPTPEEAAALIGSLHIGLETAGSPLAMINDLGPFAVASDFGNNAGVVFGPAIADWRNRPLESLQTQMRVDGIEVGSGHAGKVPGGPMAAVAFLLHHLEMRGKPLKAGQFISTGATTGIHSVKAGSQVQCSFGIDGMIEAAAISR